MGGQELHVEDARASTTGRYRDKMRVFHGFCVDVPPPAAAASSSLSLDLVCAVCCAPRAARGLAARRMAAPTHGSLPPEVEALTDAQLRAFRAAFSQFDSANEGVISAGDVPMALRTLALTPGDADLRGLLDSFARGAPRLGFIPFCQVAGTLLKAVSTAGAMSKLFAVFDPDATGVLSAADFRAVFDTLSLEPMTDRDLLTALVSYADETESGAVRYGPFCERLFSEHGKLMGDKAAGAAAIRAASSRK